MTMLKFLGVGTQESSGGTSMLEDQLIPGGHMWRKLLQLHAADQVCKAKPNPRGLKIRISFCMPFSLNSIPKLETSLLSLLSF